MAALVESELNLGTKMRMEDATVLFSTKTRIHFYFFFFNGLDNMLRIRRATREYAALLLLFLFNFTVRRSD